MISKNIVFLLIFFVLAFAQQNNNNTPSEEDIIVLDNTNLLTLVYQSQQPWLIDLYAPWCGHCIKMSSEWAKLATKLKGTVKVAKIDASQYPQFNDLFGLKGFPHIVFIPGGSKDKSVYYTHAGPRTADAFQRWTLSKIAEHKRSFLQRLTNQQKWKQICLGPHSDFCTIFFLPNLDNSSQQQRNSFLKIIKQLTRRFNRQPLSWLWTQVGEHKQLEKQFNLGEQFPSVVLVNPTGRRFSVMPKSFTEDDFTEWLKNAFDIQFVSFQQDLIFGNQTKAKQQKNTQEGQQL